MGERCNLLRLCPQELFCVSHKSVFTNDVKALGDHSHNHRGRLLSFASHSPAYIPREECRRILPNIPDAEAGREWRVLRPLRELLLETRVLPLPQGGPIVSVIVCNDCLAKDKEWIGLESSYSTHRSTCHKGEPVAKPIDVLAQKVRKAFP